MILQSQSVYANKPKLFLLAHKSWTFIFYALYEHNKWHHILIVDIKECIGKKKEVVIVQQFKSNLNSENLFSITSLYHSNCLLWILETSNFTLFLNKMFHGSGSHILPLISKFTFKVKVSFLYFWKKTIVNP